MQERMLQSFQFPVGKTSFLALLGRELLLEENGVIAIPVSTTSIMSGREVCASKGPAHVA